MSAEERWRYGGDAWKQKTAVTWNKNAAVGDWGEHGESKRYNKLESETATNAGGAGDGRRLSTGSNFLIYPYEILIVCQLNCTNWLYFGLHYILILFMKNLLQLTW